MRNVFSCLLKVHLRFDLKGSTVDRTASDKEKVYTCIYTLRAYHYIYMVQAKTNPTFKDNDFTQREEKICIGDDAKAEFFAKLERDIGV